MLGANVIKVENARTPRAVMLPVNNACYDMYTVLYLYRISFRFM